MYALILFPVALLALSIAARKPLMPMIKEVLNNTNPSQGHKPDAIIKDETGLSLPDAAKATCGYADVWLNLNTKCTDKLLQSGLEGPVKHELMENTPDNFLK